MKLLHRIILVIIVFQIVALIFGPIVSTSVNHPQSRAKRSDTQEDRRLKVGIVINDHLYINQGHTVGYHYELMNRFAQENGYSVDIFLIKQTDSTWHQMLSDSWDIVILNKKIDPVPVSAISEVLPGVELNDAHDIFLVDQERRELLSTVNRWVGYFKFSEDYRKMISNYYKKYKSGYLNTKVATLSPYDKLIKRYAKEIKWDWRLLASVIYQESQFSMVATSQKDASGLMQVRPVTAEHFGIENIYDPEQNLKAGTAMLKRLETMFRKDGLDSLNLVKFTLAAYNAGEGRIEDVRRYAQYRGINRSDWDSVSTVVGEMINLKGNDTIVKLGRFRGIETINYVDEVMSRYENYKQHIK